MKNAVKASLITPSKRSPPGPGLRCQLPGQRWWTVGDRGGRRLSPARCPQSGACARGASGYSSVWSSLCDYGTRGWRPGEAVTPSGPRLRCRVTRLLWALLGFVLKGQAPAGPGTRASKARWTLASQGTLLRGTGWCRTVHLREPPRAVRSRNTAGRGVASCHLGRRDGPHGPGAHGPRPSLPAAGRLPI